MRFSAPTAAVLLALAPTAMAAGTAHVVNNCGIPVYFASIGQGFGGGVSALPQEGYSQPYSDPNVGFSIKLAPEAGTSKVTQFEFTWAAGNINYDISNIDGNPFWQQGMSLTPSSSDPAYSSCVPVICPAGEATCAAAYNEPNDIRTMVCPDSVDLTFTLCPGGPAKRDEPAHNHMHRLHSRQFR